MVNDRFRNFLEDARHSIVEVSPIDAYQMHAQAVTFIDVREESEFELEIIPDALTPGRSFLEQRVSECIDDPDTPIILYCASGVRSLLAACSVVALGYQRVMSLSGGLSAWKACGYATMTPAKLSNDERKRYGRQLILPQIGIKGQQKLKQSKMLVVGAGGLGAPCLLYLAAAGVGKIGIVDYDTVDISNLQRQMLYATADVGHSKAKVAKNVLTHMNPNIFVEEFQVKLDESNAFQIAQNFSLLVDCTDNFSARYLVNDTALALGIPVVHGSIFQFEGQVSLLNSTAGGACYRCIHAEAPPKEIAPTCSEAGVLGVVPGLIGVLQATEAIKFILDIGNSKASTTLVYNCLDGSFQRRTLHKRLTCKCMQLKRASPRFKKNHEKSFSFVD